MGEAKRRKSLMNNTVYNPSTITPDTTLSGNVIEKIHGYLTNPMILAKGSDGNMHPFVDPNPILQLLQEAVTAAAKAQGLIPNQPQDQASPIDFGKAN
jgi:hypothetical protein